MKVLVISNSGLINGLNPLLDRIKSKYNADITIENMLFNKSEAELATPKYKDITFDFIIIHEHDGNPNIARFIREIPKCKYGIIDIEHDLFTMRPELTRDNHLLSIVFQDKHDKYLTDNKIEHVLCKWYKYGINITAPEVDNDNDNDCLFLAETLNNNKIFSHKHLFRKVWVKRFVAPHVNCYNLEADKEGVNIYNLPDEYNDILSFNNIVNNFKIVMASETSLMVECLIGGLIPIYYNADHTIIRKVNDLVDEVKMQKHTTTDSFTFLCIDDDNLETKLDIIKNNPELLKDSLDMMKRQWITPETYYDRPDMVEVVMIYINNIVK